jgi:2-oxoglutarate ferredoxin oxidoreductase subunit alpha
MLDEVVGHMTEKVVIPPAEQLQVVARRFTDLPPGEFRLFEPREDLVPDICRAGQGHRIHVTGLTHDERGYPALTAAVQQKLMQRLVDKIDKNVDRIVRYEEKQTEGAEVVVVSYGITSRVAQRAVEMARAKGVKVGTFRLITAWPFPSKRIEQLSRSVKSLVVPEINLGQMSLEVERAAAGRCRTRPVTHTGGAVHTPQAIFDAIMEVAR